MPKLPKEHRFLDLSDYGRLPARWIAQSLKDSKLTAIDVTSLFVITGLLAVFCIYIHYYNWAAFLLVLKSILDAADGELSRIKNSPSYVGRYYDSIADILLNFLFLFSIWHIDQSHSFYWMLAAFICIQMQGTLYNFYYTILRNKVNGDTTSRIIEKRAPKAFEGESQSKVNLFYSIYNTLYFPFDYTIYHVDTGAIEAPIFPRWFMTLVSVFGLGFQLLIMAVLLVFDRVSLVIPFFVGFTVLGFILLGVRKIWIRD